MPSEEQIEKAANALTYHVLTPLAGSELYREAAKAALSASEGVKPRIKPLVWRETEVSRGDGTNEHDGGYEATTGFDTFYMIQMDFGTDSYIWTVQHDMDVGILGCLDDPDAAKALAQSDYEARILAALEGE